METGLTTREMTRQFRLQQWQDVFHDRKESGLTVNEYCQSHGIARDRYYYWLKVAREAAIEKAGPVFAELKPEVEQYFKQMKEESEDKDLQNFDISVLTEGAFFFTIK